MKLAYNIKILFIDPMSYNNLGIYDKFLLENINFEATFFSSQYLQFNNIKNTHIVKNYVYQTKKGLQKILSYIYSQIKVLFWIYKNNPQIIHFQWIKIPFFDLFLLFFIRIVYRKGKLIYTAHNILPHDSKRKYFHIFYMMYRLFDGIIVHEENTKNKIKKLFNLKNANITIIPHGLLNLNYGKTDANNNENKIVFSLIGRIDKYKGVDILIDAWVNNDRLLNNNAIKLIIAGKGKIFLN
jgi:glycosyltransferase involved in cell wall biosynthesis